jgi:tetratricopeptide (TPR) repeat protein
MVGREHFRYGRAIDTLASALADSGEVEQAIALHRESIRILTAWYGAASRALVGPLVNLSKTEENAGRLADAEATIRRAIALGETTKAPPRTLGMAHMNLGTILSRSGRDADALAPMERARALFTEATMTGMAAQTEMNLGILRMSVAIDSDDQAGLATAVVELERAASGMTAEWGADHKLVVAARVYLAEGYSHVGRCAEAEAIARPIDSDHARDVIARCMR